MPRQSRNAAQAIAWIARTNAFVMLCCRKDWSNPSLIRRTGLKQFLLLAVFGEMNSGLREAASLLGMEHLLYA